MPMSRKTEIILLFNIFLGKTKFGLSGKTV